METKTPFIFSRAPHMFVPFGDDLTKTLADRDVGMVVDWLPQYEALAHPSTGASLNHAGANSMMESILADVVSIFWPFTFDEPGHAAYMSENVSRLIVWLII